MHTNAERIRMRVFRVWIVTLAVVLAVFAERLSGVRALAPPFSSTFQSMQMLIGLIVPQIGVMAAFYLSLDRQREKINALSREQVTVITALSVTYHVIFVTAVIFGIGFYGFDRQADGSALERNTAAVVAIMGLFSLFLMPVAFLFATPKKDAPSRPVAMPE